MANARPWCPYLFHGRDCAPARIRKRSTRYACLGNLRLAFQKACEAAGLVVGRKHGGLVWHCTRNTAATDLAAAGCTIEDVMKVGGWKTADVARRYDLGRFAHVRAQSEHIPRLRRPPCPATHAISLCPRRLGWPRTPAFHAGNVGSNPAGDALVSAGLARGWPVARASSLRRSGAWVTCRVT